MIPVQKSILVSDPTLILKPSYSVNPQHFLYFFPLPQGHISFRPTVDCLSYMFVKSSFVAFQIASLFLLTVYREYLLEKNSKSTLVILLFLSNKYLSSLFLFRLILITLPVHNHASNCYRVKQPRFARKKRLNLFLPEN